MYIKWYGKIQINCIKVALKQKDDRRIHRLNMDNEKKSIIKNIMLIGFMGTGKSTVSAYLHNCLGLEEVDMDALIEENANMTIPQIFDQYGEEYFRDLETQTLIEVQKKHAQIVSCGGGIVLRDQNVTYMKENGKIVLLTATPQTVYERVKNSTNRPILNGNMNVQYIEQLMQKRKDRYLQCADIIIETDGKTVEEIASEIIKNIK